MKLFSCFILLSLLCLLFDTSYAARKNRKKRLAFDFSTFLYRVPKTIEILKDVVNLWEVLLREPDANIGSAIFRGKQENIIKHFLEVSSKLSVLEQSIGNVADTTIASILQSFPKMIKLELYLHDLTLIINQINFAEEQMLRYLISLQQNTTMSSGMESDRKSIMDANIGPLEEMSNNILKREAQYRSTRFTEKLTLLDFAASNTGHGFNSLLSLLRRMSDMVTDQSTNLFNLIKEVSQVRFTPHRFWRLKGTEQSVTKEGQKTTAFSSRREFPTVTRAKVIPVLVKKPKNIIIIKNRHVSTKKEIHQFFENELIPVS